MTWQLKRDMLQNTQAFQLLVIVLNSSLLEHMTSTSFCRCQSSDSWILPCQLFPLSLTNVTIQFIIVINVLKTCIFYNWAVMWDKKMFAKRNSANVVSYCSADNKQAGSPIIMSLQKLIWMCLLIRLERGSKTKPIIYEAVSVTLEHTEHISFW